MLTLLLAASLMAGQAPAEPAIADPSVKPHYPTLPVITDNDHLFEAVGGRDGLTALMGDAMDRWLANPRTRPFSNKPTRRGSRTCWSSNFAW